MAQQLIPPRRTVSATEMKRNFTTLVRQLRKRHQHAYIQSSGVAVAVLLTVEEYEKLTRVERTIKFEKLTREIGETIEKSGVSEETLMAELEETKREVFQEQYGRR
ncbi:MAG: type II toxin-antitoxin system Phd/YefM family antitoxin [Chloroflexota bacterium]